MSQTKRNYMRRYVRDGFRNKKGLVIARFVETEDSEKPFFVDVGFSLKSAKDIDWNPVTAEDVAKLRLEQSQIMFPVLPSGDRFVIDDFTLRNVYDNYMDTRYPDMNPASRAMLFNEVSAIVRDVANKPNRTCHVPIEALGVSN